MKNIIFIALMLVGFVGQAQTDTFYSNDYDESINHYQQLHDVYKHKAKKGRAWAISGAVVFVPSYIVMVAGVNEGDAGWATAGLIGVGYSFFAFNIGMPSWMFNAAKAKANADVVKEMKRQNKYMPKDLSFGATSNGIGLILSL